MQFERALQQVRSFLHTRGMELLETRAPVATPAELAPLASRLGGSLPTFLTELYSTFAGGFGFGWRNSDSTTWGSCQLLSPAGALETLEFPDPLHLSELYLDGKRRTGRTVDETAVKRAAARMHRFLPMWFNRGRRYVVVDCADPHGVVISVPSMWFTEPDGDQPVVVADGLKQFLLRHAAVAFQHPAGADWANLRDSTTGAWDRSAFDPTFIIPELEHHLDA